MCKTSCKLCNNLVISQSVTFWDDTLAINIPAGSYANGQKVCLVIAQTIPTTATIAAPVVITIGDDTTTYPLTLSNCAPATVCNIRTRTRYATRVVTDATGGVFRLLGKASCAPDNALLSIGGTDTTEGGVTT